MNFLNPAVLIGLIAASIPLILHLINLRKLKTIEFSSLKFIKELQKTRIKRLKIKQWLLLLLRTLLIVAIVMAFARPVVDTRLPYFENYSKTSAVILVDNSFSMDVSDEFGNRLKQAKSAVRSVVSSLNDGDEIAVIPMSDRSYEDYQLYRNFNFINERIDNISISDNPANLKSSLLFAYNLLDDANNLNKEIFIISDAAANIFPDSQDSLNVNTKVAGINFIQTGGNSKADIKNIAIDSLIVNNQIFQYGRTLNLEAVLSNSSSVEAKQTVVSLILNDKRVAQRSVDIPANDIARITIESQIFQRGPVDARLELETDELLQDNNRYFSFIISEVPKIAILSNDYRNNFLKLAIKAAENSEVVIDEYSNSNFGAVNLNNYDLIILSKGPYSRNELSRIDDYIEGGGSVMAFGFEEDNQPYSEFLSKIGFGNIRDIQYRESNPSQFDFVDVEHHIFDDLFIGGGRDKQTESPDIYAAKSNSGGQILIGTSDASILSESVYGEGKALYYAIAPDMSMSDFPVSSIFPALIYKSIMYLTAMELKGNDFITGSEKIVRIEPKFAGSGNFEITDPNGNELFRQAALLPSGAILSFNDMNIPGNYIISNNERVVSIFSVNTDPSESNLDLSDKSDIEQKIMAYLSSEDNINFINNIDKIDDMIIRARIGTELWQIFIILALLFAAAEMVVQKTTKNEQSGE